jgi:hypothetical protein
MSNTFADEVIERFLNLSTLASTQRVGVSDISSLFADIPERKTAKDEVLYRILAPLEQIKGNDDVAIVLILCEIKLASDCLVFIGML